MAVSKTVCWCFAPHGRAPSHQLGKAQPASCKQSCGALHPDGWDQTLHRQERLLRKGPGTLSASEGTLGEQEAALANLKKFHVAFLYR